jgi:phage gpG-like protein
MMMMRFRILGLPKQRLAVVITVDYQGNRPIVGAELKYGFTQTFRNHP